MRNKIVEELISDVRFKEAISRICRNDNLRDDLLQEFCLILLEYDLEKLQKIYDRGELLWFSIRILKNQWMSNSSPFFKKYRKIRNNELMDDIFIMEDFIDERNYEVIKFRINEILDGGIFWKDAHLFKLYFFGYMEGDVLKYPSTRDIEKMHSLGVLKLDHTSVSKSIKRTMEIVIKQLLVEGLINKNELNKKWKS